LSVTAHCSSKDEYVLRALVTGASGFLGRHLVQDLRKQELEVTTLGRQRTSEESSIAMGDAPWSVAHLVRIIEMVEPSMIFHLAGRSVGSERQLEQLNVGVASAIMQALREVQGRPLLVCCGSAAEYGSAIVDGLPVEEALACAPVTAYGASKLAQTKAALAFAESTGTRVLIARIFNPIGPGMPSHLALAEFARDIAVLECRGVLRTGNIHVSRDFIDIRDVSAALIRLACHPDACGVVNLCSGLPTRLSQLVHILIALSGKSVTIELAPERQRFYEPKVIVGSTQLLGRFGALPPPTDYEDVVSRVWRDAEARGKEIA
jgi:GDP-4-dehydro-6-deoxy-D-mannose reductase